MLYTNDEMDVGDKLVRVTSFCWLAAKIISWKLWLGDRLFPLIPPIKVLSAIPSNVQLCLFVVSLISLVILFIRPATRPVLILLLLVELLSCLADQNRWQPWEYQYIYLVVLVIFFQKRPALLLPAI